MGDEDAIKFRPTYPFTKKGIYRERSKKGKYFKPSYADRHIRMTIKTDCPRPTKKDIQATWVHLEYDSCPIKHDGEEASDHQPIWARMALSVPTVYVDSS